MVLPRFGNSILTDLILDMREGEKSKEVHVFVGSFGGEVAALNMILQQLLTYEYRVGINLGTACSCGWMLFFACQERYVSPFSQAMYHDISGIHGGKHTELQRNAEFMGRWQKELLKITDTAKVLTEKELELGRTSEVWLTGRELIERGAAKEYQEYLHRKLPMPVGTLLFAGGSHFVETMGGWMEVAMLDKKPLSYVEVLQKANEKKDPAGMPEAMLSSPKGESRKKGKKASPAEEGNAGKPTDDLSGGEDTGLLLCAPEEKEENPSQENA